MTFATVPVVASLLASLSTNVGVWESFFPALFVFELSWSVTLSALAGSFVALWSLSGVFALLSAVFSLSFWPSVLESVVLAVESLVEVVEFSVSVLFKKELRPENVLKLASCFFELVCLFAFAESALSAVWSDSVWDLFVSELISSFAGSIVSAFNF